MGFIEMMLWGLTDLRKEGYPRVLGRTVLKPDLVLGLLSDAVNCLSVCFCCIWHLQGVRLVGQCDQDV